MRPRSPTSVCAGCHALPLPRDRLSVPFLLALCEATLPAPRRIRTDAARKTVIGPERCKHSLETVSIAAAVRFRSAEYLAERNDVA